MAAERIHRYLRGADQFGPAPIGDQFEFDEADIWNVGEISFPEISNKTAISKPRKLRKSSRNNVDANDQFPIGSKSLPVNIPNWSKILGYDRGSGGGYWGDCREDEKIPPHEYLARTRVASMSVEEGVGRTLKGRDLSNLRKEVLTKTGVED